MILRLFSIALFVVMANSAFANQVTVSSGEHPGFTRVMLEFEDLPEWQSERVGRSQRIVFSGGEPLTFDLSRAFRLISRNRIGDIRIAQDGLELDIACECEVVVSQVAEGALSADVRPRTLKNPVAMHSMPPMQVPGFDDTDLALPDVSGEISDRSARDEPTAIEAPTQEGVFDPTHLFPIERDAISLEDLDLLLESPDSGTAVALLGEQLSRAAAQGLIDIETNVEERPQVMAPGTAQLMDRSNLSIATGIDRALNPELDRLPPTQVGAVCIPNSQVDVSAWGDATDPQALGQHRMAAIAEDGGIDPNGAKSLARLYLAMGFGAEAQVVAEHVDQEDREILMALADIMDRGRSGSKVLNGQIFCKGKVALWAALARPITISDQPTSTDDILATFSALPPHLRTHLGPILSERLRQLGLDEQSRTVINAMTRGGKNSGESDLATARLDLGGASAEAARESLGELSLGTDTTAAEALLELLKDAERRGMAPNPDWVTEDVPSLVRAVEGTDIAADLNLAGLRGRIALEMFDSLRVALAEESPGLDQDERRNLTRMALAKAVGTASDVDFVKAEIGFSRLIEPNMLSGDLRLDLAERLLQVGLASRSTAYLPDNPATPRELGISARVLLANGNADSAIALLQEFDGEEMAALLGRAYVSSGDNQAAISAFDRARQAEAALSSAFRSADWGWISEREYDEVSDAVRLLLDTEPDVSLPNPNGALIENSRELREQAKTLLGKTKPTTFGEVFTN